MYQLDLLPTYYCEERARAQREEELAAQQAQQRAAAAAQHPPAHPFLAAPKPFQPQNLTQALLQRPPLTRPPSTGLFGNIFQGFVRAASHSPPPQSGMVTPPMEKKDPVASSEMERLIAERKRDADICAMPVW